MAYSKICIHKNLMHFLIQNCLKQRDALLPVLFNFALEHAIRKFQDSQEKFCTVKITMTSSMIMT